MARPSRTGGKTSQAKTRKGRKTTQSKRRIAPAASRAKRRSVAGPSKDLKEAREQQAATAQILKVIASSPDDVQPVFEAIAISANRLIGGFSTAVFRYIDGMQHLEAFTPTNPVADEALRASFPRHLTTSSPPFELLRDGKPMQIVDTESSPNILARDLARLRGFRSMLLTPLMSNGVPIGLITVTRVETGSFADHHVQLLQTFADQAVIAIENARLINEVQAKTRDLSEALTYQTGSSNILRVIASSPTNVEPVLEAIVASACQLCEADDAAVLLKDGDELRFSAHHGPISIDVGKWPINRGWVSGRAFLDQTPVHVRDLLSDEGAEFPDGRKLTQHTDTGVIHSILAVPLLCEKESIGAILLRRTEVQPFNEKQIALLQSFADQAVIAIENARLFNETREALERQTATSEVLQVISSSPGGLGPVFEAMLENAVRICRASFGTLLLYEGDRLRRVARMAAQNVPQLYAPDQETPPHFIAPFDGAPSLGRLVETKALVHIADIATEHPDDLIYKVAAARTVLIVPMLKESELVGGFAVYRKEVQEFSDKQVELLENFAAQAVIAIENTRLLKELRQRTDDLSQSLDDLRTAQDRLVQTEKLASLGQLTAGIAHEIKNPLNFVNNFAALSAELTEELNEALKPAELVDKIRTEVDELTALLKSNLEKVVQHGKRADSIVKNMLLHSREGPGERRLADINALVQESLNLAYHGARAEKSDFNITLKQDLDPDAGEIEVYPQEITRALLNVISNGFYVATRRKSEAGDETFEPVLSAATKNLGNKVEIRIRDNGTGIPVEVKDKMFNPFFTTKPAGEGTGLGLSMTHDIIVKQHGGTLDVESELGVFTEFIITLPR
ncbi:histidine kinase [Bradyrhizobium genosp. SA-3]|uniref:GAF domain-containing protein n=1 Tax=Bradyrhizobium genosp. SA-3 TaxID=508868 RepID=UPI00102A1C73|nr:GAF domain-containing protein [Bradyrhizobium genosp. SA-3]RZM91396.1 histidine kinase [Bradyrhizobium genosp. SA-3]